MSTQSVAKKQYFKLYDDGNDRQCVSYPKMFFFKVFIFTALFGLFVIGESNHLSFKISAGLANLTIVGLIGLGIGLWLGSPILLVAFATCALAGLVFAFYASNNLIQEGVHYGYWDPNIEGGQILTGNSKSYVEEQIKKGTCEIISVPQCVKNKLSNRTKIDENLG